MSLFAFVSTFTEVGVSWEGFDPGTPAQSEVRMEARFQLPPLFITGVPGCTNGKSFQKVS